MSNFAKIEPVLGKFVAALEAAADDHYRRTLPESHARGWAPKYTLERGQKFIRVIQEDHGGSRCAFCFLDADGNILKCDGWKRPARGIRGSLFDPNFSIGKGLTPYGAAYAR